MEQRILCLWLPNWPVQRVLASEPSIVGRALVLEHRDARRGLEIAAVNLQARRGGARVGMRMSELAALTTASEQLLWEVRPYQPDEDLEALCLLAEEAQQFSPLVGLEPVEERPWSGRTSNQPHGMMLDVSGIAALFAGETNLLAEVAHWLRSKRLFAYMAIASTIGAAWAMANYEILARWKRAQRETVKSAADTGSTASLAGPDYVPDSRMMITEMWEEAEILSGLPCAALRIDHETVEKLKRLGVMSLNGLWQLPRDGLASRLGSALLKRSDQALGGAAESITALHGQPDWSCEFSFEHATLDLEVLRTALAELCQQLASRLAARGQGAMRCLCRLDLVRTRPLIMNLGLFRPSHDAHHLHGLLVGQLEQVLLRQEEEFGTHRAPASDSTLKRRQACGSNTKPTSQATSKPTSKATTKPTNKQLDKPDCGPLAVDDAGHVWRLSLQATLIAPIVWQQTQLFDQPDTQCKQQFAQLIDTLSSRLGRTQVVEAHVERDAEPEHSVSYRPLTGRRKDGAEQQTLRKLNSRLATSGAEPQPTDPLRRPAQLLNPPEPLMVANLDSSGTLHEFVYENRRYQVVIAWGPERLESGWWRGASMRRDYYRLETSCGSQWWVYRELKSHAWFMHGLFS